jgi:hypothetical protein
MNPSDVIHQLFEVLSRTEPSFSQRQIMEELVSLGVNLRVADRAYKFAQIACGRLFMQGLGVSYTDSFMWFNASGDVVETGKITSEPFFLAAAQRINKDLIRRPSFALFAMMSSDAAAVNDLMNKGSKPSDLVMAPAFLFVEAPTPEGMRRAQATMVAEASKSRPIPARIKRPWWRFW